MATVERDISRKAPDQLFIDGQWVDAANRKTFTVRNPATGGGSAAFEPAVDYVVVKLPRWPFDKFPLAERDLGVQMKATGEAMAIDREFGPALLKAVRSLEPRGRGWLWEDPAWHLGERPPSDLGVFLAPSDTRLWRMVGLLRHGWTDAAGISAASPTENVKRIASKNRRRFYLPGQAANKPDFFSGCDFISRHSQRTGNQHLQTAFGRLKQHGRRKSARRVGTFQPPFHFAGFLINGDEKRIAFGIAIEQHQPFGQHRRSAHSERVVERSERQPPSLLAVAVKGNQSKVREESENVLSICDGRRRSR